MSELERCLSEFEAEFQDQEVRVTPVSPIQEKVCLGIERALMERFLDADIGRYYGGSAEDIIAKIRRARSVLDNL